MFLHIPYQGYRGGGSKHVVLSFYCKTIPFLNSPLTPREREWNTNRHRFSIALFFFKKKAIKTSFIWLMYLFNITSFHLLYIKFLSLLCNYWLCICFIYCLILYFQASTQLEQFLPRPPMASEHSVPRLPHHLLELLALSLILKILFLVCWPQKQYPGSSSHSN